MSATAFLQDVDPAMILARAAELKADAIKNKAYQQTPIGRLVGKYLRQLAFDNYAPNTIQAREQILCHYALDLADKAIDQVEIEDIREHLSNRYAHVKPNTRAAAVSAVRTFHAWAHDNDYAPANPARKLRAPRQTETERRAHSLSTIRRLALACNLRRDRIALLLMYWCGLRKNELRLIQWRHIELGRRVVTLVGAKGGKVSEQSIPEPIALELERYILDEDPGPDEFLLYPYRLGRRGKWPLYVDEVIWEDRLRPYSEGGMDKWFQRCVSRAKLPPMTMHELRHSAGTHFHETGHDLVATQHFMRHANPATTAGVYIHLDRALTIARVQRDMTDPMQPSPSDSDSEGF